VFCSRFDNKHPILEWIRVRYGICFFFNNEFCYALVEIECFMFFTMTLKTYSVALCDDNFFLGISFYYIILFCILSDGMITLDIFLSNFSVK